MQAAWLRRQSGQAVVLVAVAVLVLTAILALALDGGSIYLDKRQLQNAADSAALAGAELLTAVPSSYANIHNQGVGNLLQNLPGTTEAGTVCSSSCPSQKTIGPPGGNGVGTLNLGAGYYAQLSVTTSFTYQVTVWHTHAVVVAPIHGFQSMLTLAARASAQNANLPYALVLLQHGNAAYSNLQMSGSGTALNLSGPAGGNSADRGGVFSNASIDPGQGVIYFGPCTAGPPVNVVGPGVSGDLWAVSETGADAGRVNTQAFCEQVSPGFVKVPLGMLPDPGYPEPAAPNVTFNGSTIVNGSSQILCPGHYSNQISVGGIGILYPGVYHVDAGGVSVAGTLRTFQSSDFPGGTSVVNPCGAPLIWGSFDPGVIIEVTPANSSGNTNCAKHLFTTIGGASVINLVPSTKYFNINLYIDEMPNWPSVCTAVPGGTNVVRITGGGNYSIRGIIYGPADNMQISGNGSGSGVGQIVAWTLVLNGGGAINELYDPSSLPYIKGLIQ